MRTFKNANLFFILLLFCFYAPSPLASQSVPVESATVGKSTDVGTGTIIPNECAPYYAAFFTNVAGNVLWGASDGLKLINIDKQDVVAEDLKGIRILHVAVNPSDYNSSIVCAENGRCYWARFDEGKLKCELIPSLSSAPVDQIKFVVFNPKDESRILAVEDSKIYRTEDKGATWLINEPIVITEELGRSVVTAFSDPFRPANFIVATPGHGRLLGSWGSNEIRSIPEQAIPHGYVVSRQGMSYIPIGKNDEYLNLMNMDITPLHLVYLTKEPEQFYIAGMGKSPVSLTIKEKRYEVIHMNQRLQLSFSVDIDHLNSDRLVLTHPEGIDFSTDRGVSWKTLEFTTKNSSK